MRTAYLQKPLTVQGGERGNQRGSKESSLTLEREKAGYDMWKEGKETLDKLRLGKGADSRRHLWLCAEHEE